jgi:uncharacterized protein (DUF697 family)
VPSWNEMGAAFSTLRELDVTAIREEAERPVTIFCLGERGRFDQVAALLRAKGAHRFGPAGADPFVYRPLGGGSDDELRRADLLLILLDGGTPLSHKDAAALARLGALNLPTTILICGVASPGELGAPRPEFAEATIAVAPTLEGPAAAATVAAAIYARLPGELHLALARRLPGVREVYARELVGSVSFTNASFAAASALPEQIPILAVPFVAADMIVLTKNQGLMVYRLALAHGAPPEFRERLLEVAPVIGGGFLWRQLARSLVSLIPVWGVLPKVSIAYAGTYATGVAAWRWFADGETFSPAGLRQLTNEALRVGRAQAKTLLEAARPKAKGKRKGFLGLPWPGRRKDEPRPVGEQEGRPEE